MLVSMIQRPWRPERYNTRKTASSIRENGTSKIERISLLRDRFCRDLVIRSNPRNSCPLRYEIKINLCRPLCHSCYMLTYSSASPIVTGRSCSSPPPSRVMTPPLRPTRFRMLIFVRLLQDWGYATHKRCVGVALERESHNDYYKVY
jgi:hypothetical protein